MTTDAPAFIKGNGYISRNPEFLATDKEKFVDLRKEFDIASDFPLEEKSTDAFAAYVQNRFAMDKKSLREMKDSFSEIYNFSRALSVKLVALTDQEIFYLRLNDCSGKVIDNLENQLRILKLASKSSASDINLSSKKGRRRDFPTQILANDIFEIYDKSSAKRPYIYKLSDGGKGYDGNLVKFSARLCRLFKIEGISSLKANLYYAYQNRRI